MDVSKIWSQLSNHHVHPVLTFLRGEPLAVHLLEVVEGVTVEVDESWLVRVVHRGLLELAAVPRDLRPRLTDVGVHVVALLRGLPEEVQELYRGRLKVA